MWRIIVWFNHLLHARKLRSLGLEGAPLWKPVFSFLELSRCIGHPDLIVDHFRMHCDTHIHPATFILPTLFIPSCFPLLRGSPVEGSARSSHDTVMKVRAYAPVVHQHGHQGCPLIALSRYPVTFCMFLKAVQIGLFMFFNIKWKIQTIISYTDFFIYSKNIVCNFCNLLFIF
jgi:hypothetical protein